MTTIDSRLPQFRSKTVPERLQHLVTAAHLSDEDARRLTHSGALAQLADGMIENVVGTFELPLGVAGYFQLNGKDVLVPMAVEEPSVVAAASFMAKLARECGGFKHRAPLH
jgi:hydroxymethylglutaryl-CoA reductase